MAGAREVLQFVLETDASGAVKGFQDVEKASGSSLTKTEKSASSLGSTLTKVGGAAVGAGLAMGAGLVGTVKEFEKAERAADKLDTAVSGMGSKIDTKAIQRLAFQLQQVSSVTDDQVVAAARWGAVYGLTTKQLETLLKAAVDLSAQTGKSLDFTTKALAKAASGGSYTALTKLGLTFDETAFKADSFGTTISEAMQFAGGAAAKQADTMSGQLTRMGNNWDDVKEKIGAGANEVFEPMAKAAANLSEKVANLNPALLKTVGHFAAIGSMGTTAFGSLASLGGQLVNLREGFSGITGVAEKAFSKVGLPIKDAEGSTTKFGKALGGAGMALGALGAAAALTETIVAINTATENTLRFQTALGALGKVSGIRDIGKQLKEMSDSAEGWGDKVTDVFTDIQTIDIGGSVMDVNDLQQALDELKDSSPEELARVLPEVEKGLAGITDKDPETKKLAGHVKDLQKWLKETGDSATTAAGATDATGKSAKEAAAAEKEWADKLKETNGALGLYAIGAAQAAAASKGFGDAVEGMDTDEQVTASLALGEAFHGVEESVKNLPKNFDATKASLGGYNDEQSKALKSVTDWGDAAKKQIGTLIESGASTADVSSKALSYSNSLALVMKQAGMTDAQTQAYLQTLGLTPEQVLTAIKLSGDAEAKFKLGFLQGQMDQLSKPVQAQVTQHIIMGDYQGALAIAQAGMQSQASKNPISQPVKFQYPQNFMGPIPGQGPRTGGGTGGVLVAPTAVPMATAVFPSPPANVTITLPAGTTPATTLAAIRRYQRLGGDMGGLLDTVAAIR